MDEYKNKVVNTAIILRFLTDILIYHPNKKVFIRVTVSLFPESLPAQ